MVQCNGRGGEMTDHCNSVMQQEAAARELTISRCKAEPGYTNTENKNKHRRWKSQMKARSVETPKTALSE